MTPELVPPSPNFHTAPTGGRLNPDRFDVPQLLYTAGLQRHSRHASHKSVTLTTSGSFAAYKKVPVRLIQTNRCDVDQTHKNYLTLNGSLVFLFGKKKEIASGCFVVWLHKQAQSPPNGVVRNFGVAAVDEWYRYLSLSLSNRGWLVSSSSPVSLKIRCVGQRYTLNLSRAETSSRWCGVVVRRGEGAGSGVVYVT
ncbi:hypothetical protein TNCV_3420581 [Trichonephila clavipes]|nr:hypothetical protein TNCV_3420581 [Trichonephila clavipes]